MDYEVRLTDNATDQIQETIAYISKILLEPQTAHRWSDRLKEEIGKLDLMPNRIPLTDEEPWHSAGIHKMVIGNFLVYFWVDEENRVVWITAVIYGRRDQTEQLTDIDWDIL